MKNPTSASLSPNDSVQVSPDFLKEVTAKVKNGSVAIEDLLAVCIDRLKELQDSDKNSEHFEVALGHISDAKTLVSAIEVLCKSRKKTQSFQRATLLDLYRKDR